MEMLQHSVNWIEIPVTDFTRARKFYSAIYDYDMPEMMMGHLQMGFLLHDQGGKGIGGAIVKGEGYAPSQQGSKVYLNGGTDLNTVLGRVEQAGGKVVLPKTEIGPDMGHFAYFMDTEGNQVGLHSMN